MENYPITISKEMEEHHFEIGEYLHHDNESCQYRVFEKGEYVASFFADEHDFLHICQNPGGVDRDVLYLLADQIEAHHPHVIHDNLKDISF